MNKEQAIAKLREHEPQVEGSWNRSIGRGWVGRKRRQHPQSDVDLLDHFDKTKHYTLPTMGRIENRLADLLGARVDL